MHQPLHASYALEAVRDALVVDDALALADLAAFTVDLPEPARHVDSSLVAVADNLVSRGRPALAAPSVERALAEALGLTAEDDTHPAALSFPFRERLSPDSLDALRRALVPVDPRHPARLKAAVPPVPEEEVGSGAEQAFLSRALLRILGPWALQRTELQRPVESIHPALAGEFDQQRLDFTVQLPGQPAGVVIEIDGSQHGEAGQRALDGRRDRALARVKWPTIRIPARDAAQPAADRVEAIRAAVDADTARRAALNWSQPLVEDDQGRLWLQALLVPVVVARVQKTVLRLVLDGHLALDAAVWRLAVVERDLPGARLAVDGLKDLLGCLATLEGAGQTFPDIDLRVYRTAAYERCEAATDPAERYHDDGDGLDPFRADVVLDVAVLQTPGFSALGDGFRRTVGPGAAIATVRSALSPRERAPLTAAAPIVYAGADDAPDGALTALLQLLFRKRAFRPYQVDVLRVALRGEPVVGLLPTGAGKSVCYQLPALLQPAMTIVVAPLKSLMKDQHDNLRRAGIDRSAFLNSSVKGAAKVIVQDEVVRGLHQIVFVSPERFLIQAFRETLGSLDVPVAFAVVDEAHCVSEWGHDFRTAYLRLGLNLRQFVPSAWPGRDVPVVALTGTASFDVLSDLRRELDLGAEAPTISPATFQRGELNFEIVPVPRPQLDEQARPRDIRDAVTAQKKLALGALIASLPTRFPAPCSPSERPTPGAGAPGDGQAGAPPHPVDSHPVDPAGFFAPDGRRTAAGLVFTPHANGALGVREFSSSVARAHPALGGHVETYASSDRTATEVSLERAQDRFKDNDVTVLVATKAFGMGIDKPNIRYVVHTVFSQSIEAYYQEAGRAGRDRDGARCFVLYSDQPVPTPDGATVTVDRDLMLFFHNSSFRGAAFENGAVDDILDGGARPHRNTGAATLDALLASMAVGDEQIVLIPFENDVAREIADHLAEHVHPNINRAVVSGAMSDTRSADDGVLADLLDAIAARLGKSAPPGLRDALEAHRDVVEGLVVYGRSEDTSFKALYRLVTVGLVTDYTVDYAGGHVLATVRKRPDAEHVEALRAYLARYVAPATLNNLWAEVFGRTGRGVIRDCVAHLVDFVYDAIESRRAQSLGAMEEAVALGAAQGAQAFQDRVNTYFDSRYLEPLRERITDPDDPTGGNLSHYSIDDVWHFVDEVGSNVDNARHLRGACDRLLAAAPSNGALLVLRAFTRVIEHDHPAAFASDLRTGFDAFTRDQRLSHADAIAARSTFYRRVEAYDASAAPLVAAEIVRDHALALQALRARLLPPLPSAPTPPPPHA